MGFIAKDPGGGDFDPTPEGMWQSICIGVFDAGTQTSDRFGEQHKGVILWEIPELRIEIEKDGKKQNLLS